MTELSPLPPDGIATLEIANMDAKQRVDLARDAHKRHVRGHSTATIAQGLGLNEQTVVRLIDEELYRTHTNRPDPKHLARARMLHIIEQASEVLDSGMLNATSQNVPQLLRMIKEAQDKLDAYDGNDAPKRTETVHLDLAALARQAMEQEKAQKAIPEAEVIE